MLQPQGKRFLFSYYCTHFPLFLHRKVVYGENDYADVEEEIKKIQDCVNNGEKEIIHPKDENTQLVLNLTKGDMSYEFKMAQEK